MPDEPKNEPRLAKTISEHLDIIVKVGVIVGAIAAYYQYAVSRHDLRSARTLEYIARFEGNGLATARHVIDDELRAATQNIDNAEITPEVHRRLALMVAYDVNRGKGTVNEITDLIGFFDTLQSCINMRLCDEKSAHAFFDRYASRLHSNFQPFILHYRYRSSPGYAAGLEQFVAASQSGTL